MQCYYWHYVAGYKWPILYWHAVAAWQCMHEKSGEAMHWYKAHKLHWHDSYGCIHGPRETYCMNWVNTPIPTLFVNLVYNASWVQHPAELYGVYIYICVGYGSTLYGCKLVLYSRTSLSPPAFSIFGLACEATVEPLTKGSDPLTWGHVASFKQDTVYSKDIYN